MFHRLARRTFHFSPRSFRWLALSAALAAQPLFAADTLIEFFNTNLVHYFLTIDPAEAAAIDSGAAGPGWQRTGKTIGAYRSAATAPAGAATVCRFYGNQANGGPNGHFYTAEAAECAAVKLDPGWTFERNEFSVQIPLNGACPANTVPVLRTYNGRFAQHDSNHRYMTETSTYNAMIAQGWSGEGVVFCGASTEAPPVPGDGRCGNTLVQQGRTIDYQQTDGADFRRTMGGISTFNGQSATEVTDTTGGDTMTYFLVDSATAVTNIGFREAQGGVVQREVWNVPGLAAKKQWTLNVAVPIDTQLKPQENAGDEQHVVGSITYTGTASVTVPAGTFTACKFRVQTTTTGSFSGGVQTTTDDLYVEPTIGMIKEVITSTLVIQGQSVPRDNTIEATVVQ